MTAVATDGRRLALVEKMLDSSESLIDCDLVLPIKVVNELQKLLEAEGDVVIRLSDSNASFIIDNSVLTSKLIDGDYPNYRQVIPASFENSIVLPRENFSEVLNRVSIVISESGSSVKFTLNTDTATLSASSAEIGEANESMQVSYHGEALNISFNPDYLKDPLKALDCDDLTIRFSDEYKPVVVLGDEGFLYVIMPMRN
jgi:DNA polymerase-3 subunit beta